MQTIHDRDSYYNEYKRHKYKRKVDGKLMTDRTAYISFLEVQLERVSSACLTVQGFKGRIQQVHDQNHDLEEKIQNLGRALKMSTTLIDRREADLLSLSGRMTSLERNYAKISADIQIISADLPSIEGQVQKSVLKEMKEVHRKNSQLENRLVSMMEDRLGGYSDVYTSLEKRLQSSLELHTQDLNVRYQTAEQKLVQAVDRRFRQQREHTKNNETDAVTAVCQLVRSIDNELREKIRGLERKITEEQPDIVANIIKQNIPNFNSISDFTEVIQRSEKTCSRMAQDVLQRATSNSRDLEEKMKAMLDKVDNKIESYVRNLEFEESKRKRELEKQTEMKNTFFAGSQGNLRDSYDDRKPSLISRPQTKDIDKVKEGISERMNLWFNEPSV